jgi:hypothetical protein
MKAVAADEVALPRTSSLADFGKGGFSMLRGVGIASLLALTVLTAQTPETKKQEPRTSAATADQQKETRSDREITRRIRRSVVGTEGMSTSGKNVKIITTDGKVTLRGPVELNRGETEDRTTRQISRRRAERIESTGSQGRKSMSKNISVYGIMRSEQHLSSCLDELRMNGYRPEDVSALMPENVGNKDLATDKSSKAPGRRRSRR